MEALNFLFFLSGVNYTKIVARLMKMLQSSTKKVVNLRDYFFFNFFFFNFKIFNSYMRSQT